MVRGDAARSEFSNKVERARERLFALCSTLVATNSENPPGDTSAIATLATSILEQVPGIEIQRIEPKPGIVNLVARVGCGMPGRRLTINGHLDTFPVGDTASWTVPPLAGLREGGRIYGRGACDMKAGLSAALLTMLLISEERHNLRGELVLTLVGDEETGGTWGTSYLLQNVSLASGDAMLSGDAGSPYVLRFGEKGQIWIEVTATGVSNHGAHVHLGRNAIDALLEALARISRLRQTPAPLDPAILSAMEEARAVSEEVSGAGEFATLGSVTVNFGTIRGGQSVNIIPNHAHALIDIRIPPGLSTQQIEGEIQAMLRDLPDVSMRVFARSEPTVTDPHHEIVSRTLANARELLGDRVVRNMRVGMSDARLYRAHGVPSVVYGPAPHNMGGIDEYVEENDLYAVFYVHAMTSFDYLSAGST
jgi:acetylornithine deacetylase/succinyl-diaminopimelate desuccinylase-like protein